MSNEKAPRVGEPGSAQPDSRRIRCWVSELTYLTYTYEADEYYSLPSGRERVAVDLPALRHSQWRE